MSLLLLLQPPAPPATSATVRNVTRTAQYTPGVPVSVNVTAQVGDLLVLVGGYDYSSGVAGLGTPTGPGGAMTHRASSGPVNAKIGIWTQPVTASGTQTVTMTANGHDTGVHLHLYAVTGHDPAAPVLGAAAITASPSGTAQVAPSVTGAPGALLIAGFQDAYSFSGSGKTGPAGMTYANGPLTDQAYLGSGFETLASSGATGTRTATGAAGTDWSAAAITIAPATVGPPAGPDVDDLYLHTDFRTKPDGNLPSTGDEGQPVAVTAAPVAGSGNPSNYMSIASGRLVAPAIGWTGGGGGAYYWQQNVPGGVHRLGADFLLGPGTGTPNGASVGLISFDYSTGQTLSACHLAITGTYWEYGVVTDGATVTIIGSGTFATPLEQDWTGGTTGTVHTADVSLYGDTAILRLPHGETAVVKDSRIATTPKGTFVFEFFRNSATGPYMAAERVWADESPRPLDYTDTITEAGPTSWWRGNGTPTDELGGDAAVSVGGATYTTGLLATEPAAQAFSFDGTDDYFGVPDQNKLDVARPWSVGAVFRPDVITGATYRVAVSKNDWALLVDSATAAFQYYQSNAGMVGGGTAVAGQAYRVVATISPTLTTLYVNGVQVAQAASVATPTNTVVLSIGGFNAVAGYFFQGPVQDVAIYPRALSAGEIAEQELAATYVPSAGTTTAAPGTAVSSPAVFQPALSAPITISPGTATQAPAAQPPAMAAPLTVSPGTVSTAPTALQPAVSALLTVSPGQAVAAPAALPPALDAVLTVEPDPATQAPAALAPALSAPLTAEPGPAVSGPAGLPPALSSPFTAEPGLAASSPAALPPALDAPFTAAPGLVVSPPSTYGPALEPDTVTAAPGTATSPSASYQPALLPGVSTVSPGTALAAPVVLPPALDPTELAVVPGAAVSSPAVHGPTVTGVLTASPGPASSPAAALGPDLAPGPVPVTPGTASTPAVALDPVVFGSDIAAPGLAVSDPAAYPPTLVPDPVTAAPGTATSPPSAPLPAVSARALPVSPGTAVSTPSAQPPDATNLAGQVRPGTASSPAAAFAPAVTAPAVLAPGTAVAPVSVPAPRLTPGTVTARPDSPGSAATAHGPTVTVVTAVSGMAPGTATSVPAAHPPRLFEPGLVPAALPTPAERTHTVGADRRTGAVRADRRTADVVADRRLVTMKE